MICHVHSGTAPGFMALVKELSKPNDVVEYMQNYLGNSPAAVVFAKFYISKKTYLFNKSKQENAEVGFYSLSPVLKLTLPTLNYSV